MANKSIVITRPNHENTVAYLHSWASGIIELARNKDFDIVDLEGEKANRKSFDSVIKNKNCQIVLFNGHGSPDTIFGQNNEIIVQTDVNDGLLKGRIVYSLSCDSAAVLGHSSVDKGSKAFIGYNKPFCFIKDKNSSTIPLHDKFAKPFMESSNKISADLIRGKTAMEAFDKSQAEFERWIEYYLTSTEPGAPDILRWLIWDKLAQELIGDREAQII